MWLDVGSGASSAPDRLGAVSSHSIIQPSSHQMCVTISLAGWFLAAARRSYSSVNVCPLSAAAAQSRNLFKLNFECDALFVFVVSIFEMNLENEFP